MNEGHEKVDDIYVLCVNGTLCVMNIICLNDGCSSTCFGICAINHNKTNCIYQYEGFFVEKNATWLIIEPIDLTIDYIYSFSFLFVTFRPGLNRYITLRFSHERKVEE